MSLRLALAFAMVAIVGVGCASSNPARKDDDAEGKARLFAKAPPLDRAPTLALQGIDAPGFDITDLTGRLRDALVHTSGVPVVDVLSVRAEVAACVQMPCPEVEQERFKTASLLAAATLSRVGTTLIGSLRIQRGLHEILRVSAQGTDAGSVVRDLGFMAGQQLRAILVSAVPATDTAPSEER